MVGTQGGYLCFCDKHCQKDRQDLYERSLIVLALAGSTGAALLQKAYEPGLSPIESDPYFQQIAGDSRESLKARMMQLTQEARKAVQILSRF